jgi:alpha-amylase
MKIISNYISTILLITITLIPLSTKAQKNAKNPFFWSGANVYFLLTDRFENGDYSNDNNYNRDKTTGKLREFKGGDIRGVINKLDTNYFTNLGINAIWITPVVEQIHDGVDEGTGFSYAYHGYWTRDWTALDPNFGTRKDLEELITKAHAKGIRILLDAVINHTGPVTEEDSVYPDSWVRTKPKCTYNSYETYIDCTLVENLPDVKTESNENVKLPEFLVQKWKNEGRYEQEIEELNTFFAKTGYPRAPKYYIMKWLADYITDFGIDGYRVDTVKHTREDVWFDFRNVCGEAFADFKIKNPTKVLDDNPFFLVGEVYGYVINGKQLYDFGDKKVNYFENGFSSLINFDFRNEAKLDYETLFSKYSNILNTDLKKYSVMNYVTSHDDGYPFDKKREKAYEAGTKLLLAPGISQVYYGDETARELELEGAVGDANLRSVMNWNDVQLKKETQDILLHWQKLGTFRKNHPAIGAGIHTKIVDQNYVFSRTYSNKDYKDGVVIGLDLPVGKKIISVGTIFANGTKVTDVYSKTKTEVKNGKVAIDSPFAIILLEKTE